MPFVPLPPTTESDNCRSFLARSIQIHSNIHTLQIELKDCSSMWGLWNGAHYLFMWWHFYCISKFYSICRLKTNTTIISLCYFICFPQSNTLYWLFFQHLSMQFSSLWFHKLPQQCTLRFQLSPKSWVNASNSCLYSFSLRWAHPTHTRVLWCFKRATI